MFAWLAVIAIAIALFVRLAIHGHADLVTDLFYFSVLFAWLHFAVSGGAPPHSWWPRRGSQ